MPRRLALPLACSTAGSTCPAARGTPPPRTYRTSWHPSQRSHMSGSPDCPARNAISPCPHTHEQTCCLLLLLCSRRGTPAGPRTDPYATKLRTAALYVHLPPE